MRRAVAHGAVNLLAPRLPNPAPDSVAPDAPVFIVGFLSSSSGLGQAARLAYRALERQGRKIYGVDLGRHFFETTNAVEFAFRDGRGHRGPGRVLININAPYMAYVFRLLGGRFLRGKHITGYWAWELPRPPDSWRPGFARVHELAAPSAFVADALGELVRAPSARVAAHPVALENLPELLVRGGESFDIVFSFNAASGFARKNPLALISAFKTAFSGIQNARLRMLVSNIEHYAEGRSLLERAAGGDARIELRFATLDRDSYWRWYGSPSLYASLHRAEGFGLSIAESMVLGVPVLATHWSANAEYMDESNALPVRYTLIPIEDPQHKYEHGAWADADVAHAAQLMRKAYEDRDWLKAIAARGQVHAVQRFSRFDPWG